MFDFADDLDAFHVRLRLVDRQLHRVEMLRMLVVLDEPVVRLPRPVVPDLPA